MNQFRKIPRWVWLLGISLGILIMAGCADVSTPMVEQDQPASPSATPEIPKSLDTSAAPETETEAGLPPTPTKNDRATRPGAGLTPVPDLGKTLTPGEIDPGLAPLIDIARKDLAERLKVDPEKINVVEARLVVWPDASLGCPQPDMMYIQIPMDGALIVLETGGKTYPYHTGGDMQVFLCENPTGELKLEPKSDKTLLPPPDLNE